MKDIKDNKSESPKPIRKILNKKTPPKPPKFNIMWLYGIVILAFLLCLPFKRRIGYITFQDLKPTCLNKMMLKKLWPTKAATW
jgi:hypothetical protein